MGKRLKIAVFLMKGFERPKDGEHIFHKLLNQVLRDTDSESNVYPHCTSKSVSSKFTENAMEKTQNKNNARTKGLCPAEACL